MGITDFFKRKKKEESENKYDVTNIQVQDLDVGYVFEYDMQTWVVEAVYEYDWGDNYFTHEFRIFNGKERHFLGIEEEDGQLHLTLMNKVKVRSIMNTLPEQLIEDQKPPNEITYNQVSYYLEDTSSGYFNDIAKGDNWEEFRSWDFENPTGDLLLTIEQWDTDDFEASIGQKIEEYEISNILPQTNQNE